MGEQKVGIITGAASGIGAAIALRLAADGWSVLAVARVDAVARLGADDLAIATHVIEISEESANRAIVETALATHGRLDGLVLDAAVAGRGRIAESPFGELDRMWAAHAGAVALGIPAGVPTLRATKGAVSITCSGSGLVAGPSMWAYDTTKGATVNLVRAAAFDLGPEGIGANGVCPGAIAGTGPTIPLQHGRPETSEAMPRHLPLVRWGRPDDVAKPTPSCPWTTHRSSRGAAPRRRRGHRRDRPARPGRSHPPLIARSRTPNVSMRPSPHVQGGSGTPHG